MNITSLSQISRTRPLYIYGASNYGKSTLQGLRAAGFNNIVGFIDTYRSGTFLDLPVHRFADYIDSYDESHQILIASSYYHEIEIRLLSYGIIDYLHDKNNVIDEISPETYNFSHIIKYIIDGEETFERAGGWAGVGDIEFCFCLNVWGNDFLDLFQGIALPSMLAPGNLPGLARRQRVRLFLYMRRGEAAEFRQTALFAELNRAVDTTFIYINVPRTPDDPKEATSGKYGFLYKLYMHFYRNICERHPEAVLGFLSPDMLMSDGYISNGARRIEEEGYRAVYAPEIVVDKARFLPLAPRCRDTEGGSMAVAACDLVGLAFRSLHRSYELDFVTSVPFHKHACRFIWPVENEGALLYTFHMHHFLVWPRKMISSFALGFDHDFLVRAINPDDRVYAPEDSDEMVHLNITPWHANDETIPQFDVGAMKDFLGELLQFDEQVRFLRHPCRLHYKPCAEELWSEVRARADETVEELIEAAASAAGRVFSKK